MRRIFLFCLLTVLLLTLAACGPKVTPESLLADMAAAAEPRDSLAILEELRQLDEAAAAAAAYDYLTGYEYSYDSITKLNRWTDSGWISAPTVFTELFALCEAHGYTDIRDQVLTRICEQVTEDRLFTVRFLVGGRPEFFEWMMPRFIQAGWFENRDNPTFRDIEISSFCDDYLADPADTDTLFTRLSFVRQEILPLSGCNLSRVSPIPWEKPVPESEEQLPPRNARRTLVLSRATGSPEYDHDWQWELSLQLLLPEECQPTDLDAVDTLILLDTTWEEKYTYSDDRKGFSEITKVTFRDAESGAWFSAPDAIRIDPSTMIFTLSNQPKKDYYVKESYGAQEDLVSILKRTR